MIPPTVLRQQLTKLVKNCRFASQHKTPSAIKSEKLPWPVYGGRHLVTMLPGNGIGPEMTNYVKDVFSVAHVPVDFEVIDLNPNQVDPGNGERLINEAITSIRRNGIAIKANLTNIIDENEGYLSPNVTIRAELDLFAFLVHYKSYPNVPAVFSDLDILLIRQNTEGEYSMLEHSTVEGVVESMKIMTKDNTARLAQWAFDVAVRSQRKKITVVHKDRVMNLSDGLFLETIRDVARLYPEIEFDDIYIDRCCRKLVTDPHIFDVLLMPNLYGTIVSNIICGLGGGAGLYSGVNYGEHLAIFEPATRHTGADLIGKNTANPVAMLSASAQMLRHLNKFKHAKLIEDAILQTLSTDKIHTPDIGGTHTTTDIIDNIKCFIQNNMGKYLP